MRRNCWPTCVSQSGHCAAQRADRIAAGDLHDVIRQVEVFGFHLARLDIREHAARHRQAVGGPARARRR